MLSVTEAATELGISGTRVRKLIQDGILPAQKIGAAWVLREEDVLQRKICKPSAGRPVEDDGFHELCFQNCANATDDQRLALLHELYLQSK